MVFKLLIQGYPADFVELLLAGFENPCQHRYKKQDEYAKRDNAINIYAANFFYIMNEFHLSLICC